MRLAVRLLMLGVLLLFGIAAPAAAQYMYMDANGDGVWDATDQLNPPGTPTTVDVWLNTNRNKDASVSTCNDRTGLPVSSASILSSTTLGSTQVVSDDPTRFANVYVGMTVAGTAIVSTGTTVLAKESNSRMTLSAAALASGSNTLTYSFPIVCTSTGSAITSVTGPQNISSTTTLGSTTVTSAALFGPVAPGETVSGTGIPVGTTVTAKASSSSITISNAATASGTVALTCGDAFTVTSAADFTPVTVGMGVSGTGIEAGTTVTAKPNSSLLTISLPATSASSASRTFGILTLTSAGLFGPVVVGMTVSGTGIQTGTTVTAKSDASNLTISLPPTTSSVSLAFGSVAQESDTQLGSTHVGAGLFNTAVVKIGSPVSGPGIPGPLSVLSGTTVTGWTNKSLITISAPATAAGTGTAKFYAPLDVGGYDLIFHATGGTVDYSAWAPAPGFSVLGTEFRDATDATVHQSLSGDNLFGLVKLGSMTVTITDGAPRIDFVDVTTIDPAASGTFFATNCDGGSLGAFTYAHGLEWVDVDGLARSPTAPNPFFVIDMTVMEGTTDAQDVPVTDPNGDALTFTKETGPPFMAVTNLDANTAHIALAPTAGDAAGSPYLPASIRATDPSALFTLSNDFTITVNPGATNQPPVLGAVSDMTVAEGATATQTLTATDPDSDPLTFSLTGAPSFASILGAVITLAPGFSDSGAYTATAGVSDGVNPVVTQLFNITVTNVNRAPAFVGTVAAMIVNEGAIADQSVSATDADGQPLTFAKGVGPAFMTVTTSSPGTGTGTAMIDLAPDFTANAGSPYAGNTVTVTDGVATTTSNTFTITVNNVNRAPAFVGTIADMAVDEGSTADQGVSATDADSNPLTFAKGVGPAFMTVSTTSPGTGTGTGNIHLAPVHFASTGSPYLGNTVTVTDGIATTTSNTFRITVTMIDNPPILGAVSDMTVAEGATATQTLTATDPDSDPLTFSLTGAPSFASILGALITLAPGLSDAGAYTATAVVSDGGLTDSQIFDITVTMSDRVPIVTAPSSEIVEETGTLSFDVTAWDRNGDAIASLSADTSNLPIGNDATFIPGSGNTTGTLTWHPALGTAGRYFVVFTASNTLSSSPDTTWIEVGALGTTIVGTFSWTPTSADIGVHIVTFIAKDAAGDSATASTQVTVAAALLSSELTPARSPLIDLAAMKGPIIRAPLTVNATVGVPLYVDVTADSATTLTTNTSNLPTGNTATFVVDRDPVVDAPLSQTTSEGKLLSFSVTASDPDGNPIDSLTASGTAITAGAAFTADPSNASGTFSWLPSINSAGSYDVTFTALNVLTASATTSITVFIARPPVLDPVSDMTVAEGATATQLLTATDPDGDPLTFSLTGAPSFASILGALITLAPGLSDAGGYAATAVVSDGLLTDSQLFNITVRQTNQAPVLPPVSDMTVAENATATQQLIATDLDGDALTFSLTGAPAFASIASGLITLAPGYSDAGDCTATAVVSDGRLTDSQLFNIRVTNTNRDPMCDAGGPYSGTAGSPVHFDGSGSYDPDGEALTYSWDFGDGGVGAGVTVNHTYAAQGTYVVTLCVTDPHAAQACCTADVTISPAGACTLASRAFTVGGDKTLRLGSGRPKWCAEVEPVGGSFLVSNVNLSTIKLTYSGASIFAIGGKTVVGGDKDKNGVVGLTACFTKADLRTLFTALPRGNSNVTVTISGELFGSTAKFCADVQMTVDVVSAGGGALVARVSPNPLNPEATLTFATTVSGRVKVAVFDLGGRLVCTLVDGAWMPAGYHDVRIDGRTGDGARLASGVYYYRIEAAEGKAMGRFAILK